LILTKSPRCPGTVTTKTPSYRTLAAVLSVPGILPAPSVITIHGYLGSTAWYKSLPNEFAKEGFIGLAVDLFDGEVTSDPARGRALMASTYADADSTIETLSTWIDWLRRDRRTNGKVGIVGYSMGARWALAVSLRVPVDATVIYYSVDDRPPEAFRTLYGPVLAHFAERDAPEIIEPVRPFDSRMRAAGKSIDLHWYAAGHSFANPEQPGFDRYAAEAARARTVEFLRTNLR